MASASGAAFKSMAVVGEKVILNHYGPDQDKWLKAIALALVHNDKDTRLTASLVVKRLANVLGGQETMEKLAADINEIVWQGLDLNPDESNEQLKVANVTIGIFYFHEILFSTYKSIFDFTKKIISILIFLGIENLCKAVMINKDDSKTEKMSLALLPVSHHPAIMGTKFCL